MNAFLFSILTCCCKIEWNKLCISIKIYLSVGIPYSPTPSNTIRSKFSYLFGSRNHFTTSYLTAHKKTPFSGCLCTVRIRRKYPKKLFTSCIITITYSKYKFYKSFTICDILACVYPVILATSSCVISSRYMDSSIVFSIPSGKPAM